MRKVLIVGATSAIAERTARLFAARGDALFLVGRHAQRLQAIADDLTIRGAPRVATATLDVADFGAHQAVLERAERELGGIDIALIAHGTLSNQAACQETIADMRREIDVNGVSVIALLTVLANRFEARRQGTLAVISSVAGDRGRQSNYAYGSSKGGIDVFLAGMRHRLAQSLVRVVTIKPGLVDTPMTASFPKGGPLWSSPERVGECIDRAIRSGRGIAYVPGFWRVVMLIIRHLPAFLMHRTKL